MHHFGEAKDQEGEGIALGGLSRMQTQGDEIHQRVNVFDVISTGDHGAVSVREIGDDEQD
jgi:hypothetical protein